MSLTTPDYGKAVLVRREFEALEQYDNAIITLTQAKLWAGVDGDELDGIIDDNIQEAMDLVQEELNLSLNIRKVTATFESFAAETRLPNGPVVDVLSVKRLDKGEVHDIEGWYRRGDSIYFETVYGYEHPYYRQGLEVEYLAGFWEVPAGLRAGIRQMMLTILNDREDVIMGGVGMSEIPSNSRRKLMKYRRY